MISFLLLTADEIYLVSIIFMWIHITFKNLTTEEASNYTVSCPNFTHLVSRGKLSYLEISVPFCCHFVFFLNCHEEYSCSRPLENEYVCNFEILCHVFFKGFVTSTKDLLNKDQETFRYQSSRTKLSNMP